MEKKIEDSEYLDCLVEWFHEVFKNLETLGTIIKSKHGILVSKLSWPTVRKKCSSDRGKLLKFKAESQELRTCKNFEITKTICSNSENNFL